MATAVLLATADPGPGLQDQALVLRSAAQDTFQVHAVTDDPASADVIVFFDSRDELLARDVRAHPLVRRYREKCFLFDPSDRVIPFLPGIYASIERRYYDPSRVRSGFFPCVFEHGLIDGVAHPTTPTLLFCFVGEFRNAAVRRAIGRIRHPRALIRDTAADPANAPDPPDAVVERFHRAYAAALLGSQFVLCPRGVGASTFRLFETLRAGRVPVILSDAWVAPEGPDWGAFSIRVNERDVRRVPDILERREDAAAAMGLLARRAWEEWFSEGAAFHRIVEWCLSIQRARRMPERYARTLVFRHLLEPHSLRHRVLPALRRWIGT